MKWPWSVEKPSEDTNARLERLEREWKSMMIEWEEWYDKFRRLYARIAKRAERATDADTVDGRSLNGSTESVEVPATSRLNDRQLAAQRAILARRGGRNAVSNGEG